MENAAVSLAASHTASGVALVGGGGNPRPGEISLAHHGVLFLDELPEFDRSVLEVLREPAGKRAHHDFTRRAPADFPAEFQLIAAMNPARADSWATTPTSAAARRIRISRYRGKISGPLLDRIDLQIEVPAVPQLELVKAASG